MNDNSSRRLFLKTAAAPLAAAPVKAKPARSNADIYQRLGIRPVINGVGVVTVLGGSIMPPEVVRAVEEGSRYFVPLPELERKVGERIAELLQAPSAMVTCGAASAITVGTAACLSQGDSA